METSRAAASHQTVTHFLALYKSVRGYAKSDAAASVLGLAVPYLIQRNEWDPIIA